MLELRHAIMARAGRGLHTHSENRRVFVSNWNDILAALYTGKFGPVRSSARVEPLEDPPRPTVPALARARRLAVCRAFHVCNAQLFQGTRSGYNQPLRIFDRGTK
jgi:hypothetical protein